MTNPFFPNQTELALQQESRLRSVAASLLELDRYELYSIVSTCVSSFSNTVFQVDNDVVLILQNGQEIAFPRPIPMVKLSHIIFGYEEWLHHKYCLPGFVEVQTGDVVVDCGSYVGGFSISAGKVAAEVHAFEPEKANASCATRNLSPCSSAKVSECGLYNRSGEMILNVSSNSVEHSLLQPDDNIVVERRQVPILALADYARSNGIERFDFVKIEAEGVELEVFEGLGVMRPRQLAIDVSPEREGLSPAEDFRTLLTPLGYEIRQRGHVMFARLIEEL